MSEKPTCEELEQRVRDLENAVLKLKQTGKVTSRKKETPQSNDLFERIFNQTHFLVAYMDPDFNFIRVNQAYADAGRNPPETFVGKNHFDLYPHEENKAIFQHVIQSGKPYTAIAKPFEHPDHPERKTTYWDFTLSPTLNAQRVIDGILLTLVDVTEHKRSEEILQDERRRLADILKGTNSGTWEWNVQTGQVIFNERWAAMIGYELDEIGPASIETWMKFCHPDDFKVSAELLAKHFRNEIDYYEYEARMKHKDGSWIWVLDRGRVTSWTGDGKPLWMYGTHQDITLQKQAGAALRESEKKYRSLVETTSDCIWEIDPQGFFTYLSPTFRDLLGYDPSGFLGRTPKELIPADEVNQVFAQFKAAVDAKQPFVLTEHHNRHKSGRLVSVSVRGVPFFTPAGDYKGMRGITRDTTSRRQAEDAVRLHLAVMETVAEGICLVGVEDNIIKWTNSKFEQMFGYDPGEMVGMHVDTLNAPTGEISTETGISLVELPLETGEWQGEIKNATRDGRHFWCHARVSLFDHPEFGEVMVAAHTDITAHKQAEEKRLRLEQSLQQAKKAESLARMAGAIAHNYNNMLGAVIGNLEIALDDAPESSQLRTCVGEAMQASSQAAEISRLMLMYLGQTTGNTERFDLSRTIKEACTLLNASIAKNVRLEFKIPFVNPIIQADRGKITQILTNLVANAVEAIAEREGEIALDLHVIAGTRIRYAKIFPFGWEARAKEYACISVADNGPGMDAETVEMIFDPFFSTKFAGRGLGLSVVLGLVRAFDGAIAVENSLGRGTVFRVLFPVSDERTPYNFPSMSPIASALKTGDYWCSR